MQRRPPISRELRKVYPNADLSIRPKTHVSKIDPLKETIRAYGHDPDLMWSI